ncbi:UNVERIFIED_CONTAM: hypothetical protein FKN15_060201 [Acipenser sinensis]
MGYEDTWATLHKRAKESAIAGEAVDEEVVMLSAHWEKRRNGLLDLQEQLQQIPAFLAHLESITSKISHLEADFEEVESHLINLEDLCGQCELQRYKQFQMLQVENYKKKKRSGWAIKCGIFLYKYKLWKVKRNVISKGEKK